MDSIAWLLNLRGNDIKHTPLLFCYVIIPQKGKIELFIDRSKIEHLIHNLSDFINIQPIQELDNYLLSINLKENIGVDEDYTPYHFKNICKKNNLTILHLKNPCLYLKARKNNIELDGAKKANIRDGVSITKFLFWLKTKMIVEKTDEIKAADYLLNLRKKNDLFYSPSFDTISAFGPHAALPHYRVNNDSNLPFENNSIFLCDSGGQYKDGTTDITRTIIIGTPTEEQKDRFTRVLKGHIKISAVIFPTDTKGSQLDQLARKSLQEINCDYDHGTGHGIGSFLSVHEGPQRISKISNEVDARSEGFIKEGMIISNEPGYYKEGEYGIRIENLMICCVKDSDEPNLLCFETISWAPIDKDLIQNQLLDKKEIQWINNYHKKVYQKISLSLNTNEREWLNLATSPLK